MEEEKKIPDGISAKVWQKIADKHLKPLPRWRFLVKELILWGLFFVFLLVASIACAFILLEFLNADWDLYPQLTGSLIDYITMIFPYFWLICLSVVVVLAYYNFSLTRRGYKYGLLWIFLGTIFLSGLLGAVLYFTNLGQWLDSISEQYLPGHRVMVSRQSELWNRPEEGWLGGQIIMIALPQFVEIKSFDNHEWLVVLPQNNQRVPLRVGEFIKILGSPIGPETFEAKEIRPWRSNDCPCCADHEESNESCKMETRQHFMPLPAPVK